MQDAPHHCVAADIVSRGVHNGNTTSEIIPHTTYWDYVTAALAGQLLGWDWQRNMKHGTAALSRMTGLSSVETKW